MAGTVTVGFVVGEEMTRELAEGLSDELPGELRERVGEAEWRCEVVEVGAAEATAEARELEQTVRDRMLADGWELGIGVTNLPLRAGRRPVTAHASASNGVGLLSLPALGALHVERRLNGAVVHLIEGLLGESVSRGDDPGSQRRRGRLTRRLDELRSPLGHPKARDDGALRFVGATLAGNLRLFIGMIRANQPTRLIARLSAALFGALGTAAFSLASSNVWQLADQMTWPRLVALAAFSVLGTCIALVAAHGLWERAPSADARERVVLFNLASCGTLAIGVTTMYAGLFAVSVLAGAVLIPPDAFAKQLGHPTRIEDYIRLAWLVASLATVGGALGSLVDSDEAVREAAYRPREDDRTEDEPSPRSE